MPPVFAATKLRAVDRAACQRLGVVLSCLMQPKRNPVCGIDDRICRVACLLCRRVCGPRTVTAVKIGGNVTESGLVRIQVAAYDGGVQRLVVIVIAPVDEPAVSVTLTSHLNELTAHHHLLRRV